MVDQQPAHDARNDGKKVPAIFPVNLYTSEANVSFVNQRRWLQRVLGTLVLHVMRSESSQVVIHQRQQLID